MSNDHDDPIPIGKGTGKRQPAQPQVDIPGDAQVIDGPPPPSVKGSLPDIEISLDMLGEAVREELGNLDTGIDAIGEVITQNGDELRALVRAVERLGDILGKRLS